AAGELPGVGGDARSRGIHARTERGDARHRRGHEQGAVIRRAKQVAKGVEQLRRGEVTMTDERLNELLADASRTYRVPTPPNVDDIWAEVEREAFDRPAHPRWRSMSLHSP